MYRLSNRSLSALVGVHPSIAIIPQEAIKITPVDFMVFEGIRTMKRQRYLYSTGASKTLDSYHLYGLAIDIVPYVNGELSWEEEYFPPIVESVKTVIDEYNLPVQWGYDLWKWDLAHWQMSNFKRSYDARKFNPIICK